MQIVRAVPGGIKSYIEKPDCLDTDENRPCPFCSDGHRLQRHGWYLRYALVPGASGEHRLGIRRLFCTVTGRTVSLLPDFCIPRRQIGPAILGLFVQALVSTFLGVGPALQLAMGRSAARTTGQDLLEGFWRRADQIRAYLSSLDQRVPPVELPPPIQRRRPLLELHRWLMGSSPDPAAAFVDHGRSLHAFAGCGLA